MDLLSICCRAISHFVHYPVKETICYLFYRSTPEWWLHVWSEEGSTWVATDPATYRVAPLPVNCLSHIHWINQGITNMVSSWHHSAQVSKVFSGSVLKNYLVHWFTRNIIIALVKIIIYWSSQWIFNKVFKLMKELNPYAGQTTKFKFADTGWYLWWNEVMEMLQV